MRMKDLSLCLLLSAAIQSVCYADVTRFATANLSGGGLPAKDRKALLDASRFHEVHSTKHLPPAVVALCVDDKGKLADPGQNWNATDAVTDPTLPWKRLILGSRRKRLLRRALRARRNRSLVSRFGCETDEE
jgi:hypothetical protein